MSWKIPISGESLPGRRVTRRDRVHAEARQILATMRDGVRLHHCSEVRRWWLSDGTPVEAEVAAIVTKNPKVIADADTLFAGALTQTFIVQQKESRK